MREGDKLSEQFVVIVTGAASGIGKAVALGFAKSGYQVFLTDIDQPALKKVVEVEFSNCNVGYHCGDVSLKDDVKQGLTKCISMFGRVDVLVADAAIMVKQSFLDLTEEQWDRCIDINLKGVFLWGQSVAKWMVDNRRTGRIINISCMRSQLATSDIAPYVVSKSGIAALTKAMGIELAPYGINVNAIAPGRTITEGAAPFYRDVDRRKKIEALVPLGRLAEPEEIADISLFLASEKAKYMVGTVIPVDGGYTIYKE